MRTSGVAMATAVLKRLGGARASDAVRRGEADVMIAGGAHTMVHPSGLSGLQRLGVLTESCERGAQAMRPFDRDRDGFVAGEAGATIVLEEYEHARRRGADIWTELVGYAAAHDAYRPTDTHPEARGLVQCIQRVLQQAQIDPADITYISTHGTSTQLNDRIETFAIKRAFGHEAYHIPCSSVKSMVGHSTTACGAVEAVVCAMVLRTGEIAPTINYETPDPDCDLDYVPNIAREYRGDYVLSNNLGFGGQNAVLLFRRV